MAMTHDPATDHLPMQMETVQQLYTELFMLMLEQVTRDPESPDAGSLDGPIEQLMETIGEQMRGFVTSVREARASGAMPEGLDGQVLAFEAQLKHGLQQMHGRVETRMKTLSEERDSLRNDLEMIRRKRQGARGYRQGMVGGVLGKAPAELRQA